MKQFNLTRIVALLFAAFIAIMPAAAQNYPFQGGEKLTYKLRYKLAMINADIATLEFDVKEDTYKGVPCYRLVTDGATSNLVHNIVKVKYHYDSRFTRDGLIPLSFYREQTEGSNYWAKNNYTWDASGKRLHAIVDKSTRPHRDTVFTSSSVIYDVISTLYAVRAADLDAAKGGTPIRMVSALDCNMLDLKVSYVKTENVKVPDFGTVKADKFALYFRPRKGAERRDKESAMAVTTKEDGNLTPIYLWITPDESRSVVQFSTAVSVGNVVGRLVNAKGIKAPISIIQ